MQDLLIIGGGPIGLTCGIEAQRKNLSYTIVEKGVLVNSIYNYPVNMRFFSTSEKLEIGDVPFVSHTPKPTRPEALEYYRRVAMHFNLNIHLYQEVQNIEKVEEGFRVTASQNVYESRNIVIASGFYDIPNRLSIPGGDLPKVQHYYKEPLPYFNQKVVVIGASNSAVDVALECWRKGSEVTMIIRQSEISERVKYWVRPDIDNRIKEGAIPAYFNAELTEIREEEVSFVQNGKIHTIDNDFVLAMTGYQPNFDFLRKAGIKIQENDKYKPVYDPETMETNVPGIYLAGVICGGMETHKWFIENSRVHARMVTDAIAGKLS